tara:strand:+ start:17968 stop:19245 length:1278 start_codon:yes stop_codon:yes gene_type:complete
MPLKQVRRKKPRTVHRKLGFEEVNWDGWQEWTGEQYHRKRQWSTQSYYTEVPREKLETYYHEWLKAEKYSKEDISAVKCIKSSPYMGVYARQLQTGMPDFNQKEDDYWQTLAGTMGNVKPVTDYMKKQTEDNIKRGKVILQEKKEKQEKEQKIELAKPSIQQVMYKSAMAMTDPLEEEIFKWEKNYNEKTVKDFRPVVMLRRLGCKGKHAQIIRNYYQPAYEEYFNLINYPTSSRLKELSEWEQDQWSQLKEAYEFMDKKSQKLSLELYKKILDACDILEAESKANRKPRKVKEKSAEQVVKKLKYKQSDEKYGLASVPAVKIPKCEVLAVFNTKTRKFGIYHAKVIDPQKLQRAGTGLNVKGTTITGYDEQKSLQKTIRKPDELLPELRKATKPKTLKLFDGLKTTDTKMNGRINADTILLAVF